jgi:hypothetical protein
LATTGLLGVHKQIPFIANFNNYGSLALDNGSWNGATATFSGPRNGADGYAFIPGQPLSGAGGIPMSGTDTANQMLSGRDFAALVAHIRLRGADSYHTLHSGQQGVTNATMMDQAREGWIGGPGSNAALNSSIQTRMSAADKKLLIGFEQVYGRNADGGTDVMVDGGTSLKSSEQVGVIMDGVYSVSQKKLDFLVSNMDKVDHTINLPDKVGNISLNTKDHLIAAGTHLLIEYNLTGSGKTAKWTAFATSVPFTDLDEDRTRPGVPEPGMLSLLAVAGVFGMTRRRRRAVTAEL